MSGSVAACVVVLRTFVWPDLSHWRGLPECTLAELAQVFTVPNDGWRNTGIVGEDFRELAWLSASGGGFPDSIRVWLDGDRVVMLDSEILGRPSELKPLLARLGAPKAKLDAYSGGVMLKGSEWVYPDRGLTLFVEPHNHAPLRVAAYPRTTLEEYRKKYRFLGGRRVR